MRIKAALSGDLARMMREETVGLATRASLAVGGTMERLQVELRRQVTSSGLGRRLANAWRAELYPKGRVSLRAAGLVYTRAPTIVAAFEEGVTIRAANGVWLAIPTEAAPKTGIGDKRISPATWPEHQYGPLRFVYRRGAPSLLVVDGLRASTGKRGFRRASATALRTGRGLATVVMFILVPRVRLRKRLDVAGAAAAAHERLYATLARTLVE